MTTAPLDSVGDILKQRVIHKERKEPKERKTKDQLSCVQMNNSTNEGSTLDTEVKRTYDTIDNRSQAPAHVQKRRDVEIDEYLHQLIIDGLVDPSFKAWHAGCIYALGIEKYNATLLDIRYAIERMNNGTGKCIDNPMRLFAYKLKGQMQLHAKRKYYGQAG